MLIPPCCAAECEYDETADDGDDGWEGLGEGEDGERLLIAGAALELFVVANEVLLAAFEPIHVSD